jgi:adenosylmethionine---8-amino-7-oxononanoate aminotransferase
MAPTDPDRITTRELERLDRSVVWHAFSQMQTYDGLIIESAEGCWLTDIHGRRFLDGASSLWCNLHGHRHPYLDRAIVEQLQKVAHVTNLGMSHPTTIALAERLVRSAPGHLQHVFFCGDGASAVEVAVKIAFQYWQHQGQPKRTKFLALGSAYHGDTIGTVALGGVARFHDLFSPLLYPVLRGPCPDVRNADPPRKTWIYPDMVAVDAVSNEYLHAYRRLLEAHRGEIAAVVIEPVMQCAAGMVLQPSGFASHLNDLAKEFDTLVIVDEIAVGMGRTGKLYASQWESLQPDLMCIGKGLTGGYLPMSATLATSRIFNSFLGEPEQTLYHGHTYGGNPLSAAVANASLDLLETELAGQQLKARIQQMEIRLKKLAGHVDVRSVQQIGMLGAVTLHQGSEKAKSVCKRMLDRGVWIRPLGDCIPLVPPLSISAQELELLLDSLEYGLDPTVKLL